MRVLLLILLLLTIEANGQFWQQQAAFPGISRDDGAQFSIGSLHFCGTGRGSDFGCTRDFFVYDALNSTWNTAASLPIWQERQYASAFSYQEQGYILGGENCNGYYFKTFWRYAPLTDTWEPMPEFPGEGRAGAQHFVIGSDLYWVGGRNESGILNEVWCFHFNSNQWEQLANLPFNGIWRGVGFANQTNGFVAGGRTDDANQTGWNTDTWLYDPQNDQWSSFSAQLNLGTRMYLGSAQNDSLLFVFGGVDDNDDVLSSLEKINLNTFQIEQLLPFPGSARKGCMPFVGNDYFHLSTGIAANDRLNETWRIAYSPQAQITEKELFEVAINMQDATLLIRSNPMLIGAQLKIRDVQGRVLQTLQLSQTEQVISLEQIPSGLYFVEFQHLCRQFWR
jgi:N-acetylneuraminic acid mutarotase